MPNIALRFATAALLAIVVTACEKHESDKAAALQPTEIPTKMYGKEDAECFAGLVRAADVKHMTPVDFKSWKDKLNSKDKDWLSGFSEAYSAATKVVGAHMGKTPKELYESRLITAQQLDLIEGYLNTYQDNDASRASALSAAACVKVGFAKGADLN